jgi:hypothetical protein
LAGKIRGVAEATMRRRVSWESFGNLQKCTRQKRSGVELKRQHPRPLLYRRSKERSERIHSEGVMPKKKVFIATGSARFLRGAFSHRSLWTRRLTCNEVLAMRHRRTTR